MLIRTNIAQNYYQNNPSTKLRQRSNVSYSTMYKAQAPVFKGNSIASGIKFLERKSAEFAANRKALREFRTILPGIEEDNFLAIGNNCQMAAEHAAYSTANKSAKIHFIQTNLIDGCLLLRRTNDRDLKSCAGADFCYEITSFTQSPIKISTSINPFRKKAHLNLGEKLEVLSGRLKITSPKGSLSAERFSANALARKDIAIPSDDWYGRRSLLAQNDYLFSFEKSKSDVVNPDIEIKPVSVQKNEQATPTKAITPKAAPKKTETTKAVSIKGPDKSKITFADVGGLENLKEELRQNIIYPYRNPEMYSFLGKERPKGVLLVGPSGCGKTLLIQAALNEINASYKIVKGPELRGGLWGEEEENMRQIFSQAKTNPHKPFAIVFDEMEQAVQSRESKYTQHTGGTGQFLTLMDDLKAEDNVIVFGMTNCPEKMDAAAKRRFSFVKEVPFPDAKSCAQIIEIEKLKVPISKNVDVPAFAESLAARKFSGDDIHKMIQGSIGIMLNRTGISAKVANGETISPKEYKGLNVEPEDLQAAKEILLAERAAKNKTDYLDSSNYM